MNRSYISERDKFAPCPLCGSRDRMSVTSEYNYARVLIEHGSACVSVQCVKCGLQLSNYDNSIIKYKDKVHGLVQVWDRLVVAPGISETPEIPEIRRDGND